MLQKSVNELRQTIRGLLRSPGFTLAAVAALALGIGATTTMLGVVPGTLSEPLPFVEPERLVLVSANLPRLGLPRTPVSPPLYVDIRWQTVCFKSAFAFKRENMSLSGGGPPQRLNVVRASAGAADTLGVKMAVGRGFAADEDVYGAPRVAVIAHHLWKQRYGSDPEVLGRRLRLDGEGYTIVGVLPAAVRFPVDGGPTADVWVPVAFAPQERSRDHHDFVVVARLRSGVTHREVRAELAALVSRLTRQHPDRYDNDWSFNADPLAREGVSDVAEHSSCCPVEAGFTGPWPTWLLRIDPTIRHGENRVL